MSSAAEVTWRLFRRYDHKSPWRESFIEQSEHNGRAALDHARRAYPNQEWELRKVTTTLEVVDA